MSLDVYLYLGEETHDCDSCGQPVTERICVYSANITHNLGKMAEHAGIYQHLWRPEELLGITLAKHLIGPLSQGLNYLKSDPVHFSKFNAPNGWGTYEHFVPFVEEYLKACIEYPDAVISVSR
jgi:hypothetical protein